MALESKDNSGGGDFPRPFVTIDVVLLTLVDGRLNVALVERDREPFMGIPALVGGFVHVDEDRSPEEAVARVLRQKAGLEGVYIEQLRTFAGPDRDPRGWSVAIAYLALVPIETLRSRVRTGLALRPVDEVGDVAFDHAGIVAEAVERLRGKGAYSTLPARLLPRDFTLEEMRSVYEAVTRLPVDQSSFRRKMMEQDVLEAAGGVKGGGGRSGRGGKLYRLNGDRTYFERRV